MLLRHILSQKPCQSIISYCLDCINISQDSHYWKSADQATKYSYYQTFSLFDPWGSTELIHNIKWNQGGPENLGGGELIKFCFQSFTISYSMYSSTWIRSIALWCLIDPHNSFANCKLGGKWNHFYPLLVLNGKEKSAYRIKLPIWYFLIFSHHCLCYYPTYVIPIRNTVWGFFHYRCYYVQRKV